MICLRHDVSLPGQRCNAKVINNHQLCKLFLSSQNKYFQLYLHCHLPQKCDLFSAPGWSSSMSLSTTGDRHLANSSIPSAFGCSASGMSSGFICTAGTKTQCLHFRSILKPSRKAPASLLKKSKRIKVKHDIFSSPPLNNLRVDRVHARRSTSIQHPIARGTQVNNRVYSPSRQAAKQGRSLSMLLRHHEQQSL